MMEHPYLIIKGTATDNINDADSTELILAIKGIQPIFEKTGEDKVKVTGAIRASRARVLKFKVAHVTLLVDQVDELGDFGDYWTSIKMQLQYEYIWFKETSFTRIMPDGSNLWDSILPIKVELIEDETVPLFEQGSEELTTTWQTREKFNIINY